RATSDAVRRQRAMRSGQTPEIGPGDLAGANHQGRKRNEHQRAEVEQREAHGQSEPGQGAESLFGHGLNLRVGLDGVQWKREVCRTHGVRRQAKRDAALAYCASISTPRLSATKAASRFACRRTP